MQPFTGSSRLIRSPMNSTHQEDQPSSQAQRSKLSIAWWNTSLAPTGKSRKSPILREHAADVLVYLLFTSQIDFVALGEMSSEDLEYLRNDTRFEGYEFILGIDGTSKTQFDTGYIYNPLRLTIADPVNLVSIKGKKNLRIAQSLQVLVNECQTIINLFVSHWPSLLWCNQFHADRHVLGIRLRDAVDNLINESTDAPHIILLGDYNDEPFSQSLSEQLMATRDITLVRAKPHLLYNPFWNLLGNGRCGTHTRGGSYYHSNGTSTRWHTFDQIMYSHAFISANKWRLSTENNHLADVPGLDKLVTSSKSKFDHLPVIGIIERIFTP